LGETDKALEYYKQALQFYRQTKDLSGQASTLSGVGSVYASRNEHKQAEEYYQQALELQKTIQRQLQQTLPPASSVAVPQKNATLEQIQQKTQAELARYQYFNQQFSILNTIATNYSLMGDDRQQIAYLNQALAVAREGGLIQNEADILSDIGQAHFYLGETEKAKDFLKQALKLQRAINYAQGEAETLSKIAFVNQNSGEFQQALDNLNQALGIHKQQQNTFLEGQTLSEMALVYKDLGAYDLSIAKYEEALKIFQQKYPLLTASTLYLTGIAYWQRGKSQKTPEDYVQARKSFEMALKDAHKQGSVLQEASNLFGIARTYESLKDYPQAIANANQALELSRKHNLKDAQGTALNVLSIVYEAAGDYQKALDANKQALSLSQQLGDLSSQASAYQNQGKIYTSMKQPQQAIEAYKQELKLGQQIGKISHETIALRQMAMIERDRGNLKQAKTHIDTAIKIIENTRSKVSSNDWRTSYFATVQDYYKFYIDLLMQLHKKDPSKQYNARALHISERSRARGLLELLTEAGADIRKGVDPQLLTEEKRLQQLINARAKLLQDLHDKPETEPAKVKLKKEVEDFLTQQKELQTKIRTTSPKYAQIQYPEPLKLPQIQQQLDKDTLLLQYSLGKERSYLWVVTPNSLNTYELSGREAIEKSAGTFKELLKKCQKPGLDCQKLPTEQKAKDFQEITQAATELSKVILAPVAQKLAKKRLVIVADGALQEIPFAALAQPNQNSPTSLEKSPQAGKSNYQPLLVNHEIVNLPSVTAIAIHREDLSKRQPAPKTLAVLADPVFTLDDQRFTGKPPSLAPELNNVEQSSLRRAARNLKRTQWARLPGTRKEAEQILKLVSPSETLYAFDFDANYNLATSQQLKQFRFILFATHGFADPINPELSGIVLSQIDKQGKPNIPGILHLGDIFNLDLGADLVVLSACETGVGKDVQGEGLMGLTRGLMYAGARRAVVSLWQIDDSGTSELMPQFYTAILQQKASPTTALREAQLKLWQQKNWQNPYYWAAFTLQGEWR
jgi:CHAT domain-containing protein